ncbi:Putative ribonuclease H protein At1g65750 [Linum perenne]
MACHILRDCYFARDVWTELGFNNRSLDWNEDFTGWFKRFIVGEKSLLFGVALWYLWKSRNEFTFSNVTVNTDGSVLRNPNRAAAGGIIRTSDGHALGDFVAILGSCSVTRAELHGAVLGLELAWSKGCRLVEVQLDSRAVISLLLQTDEPLHQHALEVLAFQDLCRRDWIVRLRHTYREGNKVVDFLANHGHDFPYGVHLFLLYDYNLGYILRYNCMGVSTFRNILVNQ